VEDGFGMITDKRERRPRGIESTEAIESVVVERYLALTEEINLPWNSPNDRTTRLIKESILLGDLIHFYDELRRMNAAEKLTQARLRALVEYNPNTGVMTWLAKSHPNSSRKPGQSVGSVNGQGYLITRIDGRWYRVHRLAWFYEFNEWPEVVDHINGDRLDNSIANLRATTVLGNNQNYAKHRAGIEPNVSKRKDGKWEAYISKTKSSTGKKQHLGLFATKEAALKALSTQSI